MKTDLLKIYAKSNLSPLSNHIIIGGVFAFARFKLYGLPVAPEALFAELGRWFFIFTGIAFALLRTRDMYKRILAEDFAEDEIGRMVFWIGMLKLIYVTLWLYFIFMPIEGPTLVQHLIGYVFVLCAIGIYASTSAAYLPLFLWDIALQIGFALFMLWQHKDSWETPYLAGILLLFGFYSFLSGLNLTRTTRLLVETGHALKKAAATATRANKSKSDFLSVMSHEIRTPMTGILGMVDFLGETKLTPEQKSSVAAITECSKTLLNTLNDILDLSRIEAGKLKISNINYDLHGVLGNAVEILGNIAAEKGLDLRLAIDPDVPRYTFGDPHRLRQVVMNLAGNAIKFTEKGHVKIHATYKAPMVRIFVEDTGIGIAPDAVKALFQPFAQADGSITRKYGGSGLGLSIAKQLMEMTGGKIGVTSSPGAGSTFWVELPYREPVPEKRKDPDRERMGEGDAKNVLLVEDNHINQMICTRLLTRRGHQVTVANDGAAALDLVQRHSFDVILMDCSLPGRSGFDITRDIRALGGRFKRLPIIALTANAMEDHFKKCLEAGMNDVVTKPYEPETLYRAVSSYGTGAPSAQLNDKLRVLEEEMGPGYAAQLIASVLEEIDSLGARMILAYETDAYEDLQNLAHDLKAVAGSVGLQKTQTFAADLERACIKQDFGPSLTEKMIALQEALTQETALLKSIH